MHPTTLKKKIHAYLGLNIIMRIKFTTNFDRCAMLIVRKCLTKNSEPDELIHDCNSYVVTLKENTIVYEDSQSR